MDEVIRFILSVAVAGLALAIGLGVFQFFAAFHSRIEGSSKAKQLEEEHLNQYAARNAELVGLLHQIGAPDLPSGHYSEGKEVLWAHYRRKKEIHETLTKQEHLAEIDAYYGHK